jgi:type I restriction-modification system DNA methylase subunit
LATKRIDKETTKALTSFLKDVEQLSNESSKTHRFIALVSELFPKNIVSVISSGIEKKVLRIDDKQQIKRGSIDSYFGNAVIEFENSLKITGEHAEEQLKGYVAGIWQSETNEKETSFRPLIAIASDAITWRVYRPYLISMEKGTPKVGLELSRQIVLSQENLDEFWFWLTSFLFRSDQIEPTAQQFKIDFGAQSLAFNEGRVALKTAWAAVETHNEVILAYETWKKYLTFTYGSLSTDKDLIHENELKELFLKHTYLACVARLLIWASQSKGKVEENIRGMIHQIISGLYFESRGLANLVENDFFQWVRRAEADTILYPIWERILTQLLTYNLRQMKEDVLKSIYQEIVDPKDRHDLGEYYTPDWLCERLVSELLPKSGFVSVLDPSCGSGSFLRATIAHQIKSNPDVSPKDKLQNILQNVVGIDIHPLAVTIARATYVLALGDLMNTVKRSIQIPIYLADSLFLPTEVAQSSLDLGFGDKSFGIELNFGGEKVIIPDELVNVSELFDKAISASTKVAVDHSESGKETLDSLKRYIVKEAPSIENIKNKKDIFNSLWSYVEKLSKLIKLKKNSIWDFVIRNAYRPAMIKNYFDFIVGNPPWLSYRYIENPDYQKEIKRLAVDEYKIAPKAQKLMTQMELGTVFLVHCLASFGKKGAKIGFVLPRSVLTADQHENLRLRSYKAPMNIISYWDLKDVQPLFRTLSCVLFAERNDIVGSVKDKIPVLEWEGTLEDRDMRWEKVKGELKPTKATGSVVFLGDRSAFSTKKGASEIQRESIYSDRFKQGATLVPRNFYFIRLVNLKGKVKKDGLYWAETEPEQAKESKPPYKEVRMSGQVEGKYLFTTALSKHLLPFVMLHPPTVTLPVDCENGIFHLTGTEELRKNGYREMAKWMTKAEKIWQEKREDKASHQNVYEWLDYQGKLSSQNLNQRHLVLYNAAGKNISAAYFDRNTTEFPFIVDHKLYWTSCSTVEEADYLCAILNAEIVNELVKPFQSMGLLGERDLHKKVLGLPIPEFDPKNKLHIEISKLGEAARIKTLNSFDDKILESSLAKQRGWVRENVKEILENINPLVKRLIS